ncbi:hypothetical protein IHE44_0006338 [Lamprotornis superbus]|uniref:Gypsy retrotransposon integrase-like protein 1 n=1 Tax=Lamprotornis superbus TaxID=245042 RepID=A0A835P3A6_9PASS|nr:hypothetical protein IHE44_0006338 [Lamprotornis superbus]
MDAALPEAEREVVVAAEPCGHGSKFEDIYRLLAEGCFPPSFCSIKRKNLKRYARKFVVDGGCLYYVGPKKEEKREVIVDPERRRQVFLESHFTEIGNHLGQKKTVHRIQSRYYWLGIVKDVVDWIKMCETCQNAEHNKNVMRKARPVRVESPWEVLGLDIHGLVPPRTFTPVSRHLCERWNISQLLTPTDPADPPSPGDCSAEVLKASICSVVNEKPSEWDTHLDPLLFEFRTSVNSATKYSPFFLMFNRYVCLSSEVDFVKDSEEQRAGSGNADSLPPFTAMVQEQQNVVKEIVISNMTTACKREQKGVKRKTRSLPSLAFKVEENVFGGSPTSSLKKLKKGQFVSFQIETVLPPEQSMSAGKKTS